MDVKGRNSEFNIKEADEEEDNIGGYEEEFLEYPCGEREEEEEEDAVVMVMNPSYYSDHDYSYEAGSAPKKNPGTTGPLIYSSIGLALRRNIQAWCEATGLPTSITIHFKHRSFHLHKFPLVSRSGYFKKLLVDCKEVKLPSDCPGGADIFELIANFCYGSTILMEPSNVAALRCAAEYLQMSEDYGRANLCERSDLYISQVALQGWEDTLTVLHHCETLSPHAEQLHIVSRCIDSLAFLACTELLDPVERGNRPEGRSVDGRFWNDLSASTRDLSSSCHDWWMPDLIQLPHHLFFRSIVAIRRQGMQEKYVGQVLVKFADRWIFGTEVDTAIPHISKGDSRPIVPEFRAKPNQRMLVESVVKLLPMESFVVPASFLFALLRCTLACSCSDDCRMQLETWIALQLEQANLNDLLLPSKAERDSSYVLTSEVEAMERIIKLFVSRHRGFSEPLSISGAMCGDPVPEFTHSFHAISTVGKLWDEYLAEIAYDLSLTPLRFADLVEKIPSYARLTHDRMYKAIHTYLEGHPKASQEERLIVCRALNCQKLTLDVCTHAVQNELMPLRMIVQAMFMQQLQTRTALNSHSRSAGQSQQLDMLPQLQTLATPFAHQHIHRRCTSYQSHDSFESTESFRDRPFDEDRMPLGYIVKRDSAYHEAVSLKADYQATETRLQILEAELSRMRKLLAETTADESSNQNQGSFLSSTTKVQTYMAGREEWQPSRGATGSKRHMVNPLPTVPEGRSSRAASSGCMNQLKKVNRTSGLLARALQKLGFQNFGFSQKGRSASGGGDSKSSTNTFPVEEQECGTAPVAVPWWPVKDTGRSTEGYQLENGTSRTDRISAPSTGVRYHHSRHISIG